MRTPSAPGVGPLLLALALVAIPLFGSAEPTSTAVRLQGADVDLDAQTGVVDIGPELGESRGANLLHRFSRFDVAADDLVDFTSRPGTENIIARIDGSARSEIFGSLQADTSLFLLNPAGFLFGPTSQVSVAGSFHLSTADVLLDESGLPIFDPNARIGSSTLISSSPKSFGFLDPLAGSEIFLDGARIQSLPTGAGGTVSLIGGDVRLVDSTVSVGPLFDFNPPGPDDSFEDVFRGGPARDQRIDIASVRSPGVVDIVDLGTDNDALFAEIAAAQSTAQVRDLLRTNGSQLGSISLVDSSLRTDDGAILVRGHDVTLAGSTISAGGSLRDLVPPARPETALVDIRVPGALQIEGSSLRATGGRAAGIVTASQSLVLTDSRVSLQDVGGQVGTFTSDPVTLLTALPEGLLPSQLLLDVEGSADIADTAITASGAITVRIDAERLAVRGAGLLTIGVGAGNVRLRARRDVSLIDTNVFAAVNTPASFEVRANGILADSVAFLVEGELASQAPYDLLFDAGDGALRVRNADLSISNIGSIAAAGDIDLLSNQQIVVEGSSIASFLLGAPSSGAQRQRIGLGAPEIVVRDTTISTTGVPLFDDPRASVIADTDFAPPGGIIAFSGRPSASGARTRADRIEISGSRVATNIAGNPLDPTQSGGDIDIFASGPVLLDDHTELSVNAVDVEPDPFSSRPIAPSIADAGRIRIDSGALLVLGGSTITGSAIGGQGGEVAITSNLVLTDDPDGLAGAISVEAASGLDGSVAITSPDVDLEAGISALSTDFLNVSSLVRPSCELLADAGERGELRVERRGLAPSPSGLLIAFDSLAEDQAAADSDLPPVASGYAASFEGARLFELGRMNEADASFVSDAQDASASRDAVRSADALRGAGQVRIASGRYLESIAPLREALAVARASRDTARAASAQASLAAALFALGRRAEARQQIEQAVRESKRSGVPRVAAAILNNAANQYAAMGDVEQARQAYAEAASFAARADDRLNEVKALANAARLVLNESEEGGEARSLAARALERSAELAETNEKAYVLIHLGDTLRRSPSGQATLTRAYEAYREAIRISGEVRSDRVLSYAYGRQGALYAERGRAQEALYLTRQAIAAAERADAPESAYLWHWQEGRLLWRAGRAEPAAQAYERAVAILERTRNDSRPLYGDTSRVFSDEIEPVYRELANVLIDGADRLAGTPAESALLRSARGTVEKLKAAELRDYFRDECVANLESKSFPLESLSSEAMVIYPIALDDRIELLIHGPGGFTRRSVPVALPELDATARDLRERLAGAGAGYARPARKLYDWLVRPYADVLDAQRPKTLVFVPSGSLQNVPMGALMDGDRYLLESYSIAVTPSMNLIDPRPLDPAAANVLVAGISDAVTVRLGELEERLEALPSVDREIAAIEGLFRGAEVLRGGQVTRASLGEALREVRPNILHIATHGLFTGDPETSFLALSDGALTMNELAKVIAPTRFRERNPLELLVLSACETASGDERAGLGLAGVAVRSGARSAIGSLWSLDDRAAQRLVVSFYENLERGGVSKAEALRRAQLALLRDESRDFVHPYFWANLALINNWL